MAKNAHEKTPQLSDKPAPSPHDIGFGSDAIAEPSMARQRVLEEEREKAIKAYRQIKEKKIQESESKRAKKA